MVIMVSEAPAVRHAAKYNGCDETYITLRYSIKLRRRALYYFIYMVAPITAVAFLALISFCLPPESGERIGFG